MKKFSIILSLIFLFSVNLTAQQKCNKNAKENCKTKKECKYHKSKKNDMKCKNMSLEAQPGTSGNTTTVDKNKKSK